MDAARARHRQGSTKLVDGIPYPDPATTLSILPNALVGRWLASRAEDVTGDLLDLGAGNQPFRPWYEPKVKTTIAVDATPAPGLDALAFAAPIPFLDDSFDTVLCTSVLEHVSDAEAAVAEMARVLRPGGHLLITVPFLYPTHEAPYDFWRTTHHGLRSVLERHGLEVDDVSATGGPFVLVAHFVIGAIAQLMGLAGRRLGLLGRLLDNKVVHGFMAWPQQFLRSRVSFRMTGLSRAASLGYMASAHKPGE